MLVRWLLNLAGYLFRFPTNRRATRR